MITEEMLTEIENNAYRSLLNYSEYSNAESIRTNVILNAKIVFHLNEKPDLFLTDDQIETIAKSIESKFGVSMSIGSIISAEEYTPWLSDSREDINWYYWNRYKMLLKEKKFPPKVISTIDYLTDNIIDHLENPLKEGEWKRRGMVVGHVQSGKTANYTGVINKAADSGYKVIIVLAGMLNSLRSQTQERIDEGFIGKCTELNKPTGVGLFENKDSYPPYFTTKLNDFKKNGASQVGVRLGGLTEPAIFIIKKNKSTLENLIEWLKHNNPHNLNSYPMLLIDDEADQASVNTNKEDKDPTAINKKIRELLKLFNRSSYIGYTATPFANIFIDPETNDEMTGDDLFPRDFIISLDPPTNYVGAKRIFSEDSDLDIIRPVYDFDDYIDPKHKKDYVVEYLPESLKKAIRSFILIRAIRIIRGQSTAHNSMMINITRFTDVQTQLKLLVDSYLKELRNSIANYAALNDVSLDENLKDLKITWENDFTAENETWEEINKNLKKSVSPVDVVEVNSKSEPLDYSRNNYPNGRNVISVGGLSLSRGLTLEGLTVSYFMRNSIMYDTLMQMGRWFGYRPDYETICRIYMKNEAISWYSHITEVLDELTADFKQMQNANMTPNDYGLCVRRHPESLIVTARNKMRSSKTITRKIGLAGKLIETSVLLKNYEKIDKNRQLLADLLNMLSKSYTKQDDENKGYFWSNVKFEDIESFIKNFENHPMSQMTNSFPILDYFKKKTLKGEDTLDIILFSPNRNRINFHGYQIGLQERSSSVNENNAIEVNKAKRRVGYAIQESVGLDESLLQRIKKEYIEEQIIAKNNKISENIPARLYRKNRSKPLLMLHLLDCKINGNSFDSNGVVAYGISFNSDSTRQSEDELVEYEVNKIWWKNEYSYLLDDEEVEYE
ncbi:MAG: Z1 domain-containing protein [Candidatus Delongbacteria bacterium]|nr:Z1 domain-containing protein [Candidatus Delongbacteria bacterium]MBN2836636.1 Z1 domain-containing protein [Candidatus Delongbacteria bacterium]